MFYLTFVLRQIEEPKKDQKTYMSMKEWGMPYYNPKNLYCVGCGYPENPTRYWEGCGDSENPLKYWEGCGTIELGIPYGPEDPITKCFWEGCDSVDDTYLSNVIDESDYQCCRQKVSGNHVYFCRTKIE